MESVLSAVFPVVEPYLSVLPGVQSVDVDLIFKAVAI